MNKLRQLLPPMASLLPFEATVRLGSITRASDELGLTQAAVSKQIKLLETHLGTQLFERRNRAVIATDDGRELARIVAESFASIGGFAETLRLRHKGGEVVLRAQLCEGLYWLMPRLSGFYQTHPNIEVRVSVSTAPITEADERFDLALQTTGRASGNATLAFSVDDEVFPICSPGYLESVTRPLDIDNLHHFNLLHHKANPQDWVDWDNWLLQVGSDLRVGLKGEVYDSYPLMMQATLEWHGLAIGWRRTSEHLLQSGALVQPFNESLYLKDGVSVYHPSDWPLRENTRVLLHWLQDEFSRDTAFASGN
ncbi:MAG: LysR substrate-binding domain-containing protein [Pseudomonadota bacterium]